MQMDCPEFTLAVVGGPPTLLWKKLGTLPSMATLDQALEVHEFELT